jgi:hypothetical protein
MIEKYIFLPPLLTVTGIEPRPLKVCLIGGDHRERRPRMECLIGGDHRERRPRMETPPPPSASFL